MGPFIIAFTFGLFGSLHCVGMCGPIVLSIPMNAKEKFEVAFFSFFYHLGRISTYVFLGFLLSILGWGVAIAGFQKQLAIILGALMILIALYSLCSKYIPITINIGQNFNKITSIISKHINVSTKSSAFKLGLLNGFIPCGLVYFALAAALSGANMLYGVFYMFCFGLGTIPLLLIVMMLGKFSMSNIIKLRSLFPYFVIIVGIMIILRGLNMSIPLEFSFWEQGNFPPLCH